MFSTTQHIKWNVHFVPIQFFFFNVAEFPFIQNIYVQQSIVIKNIR